ncbi:MAG: N-formylglutamate amidohydrolase [Cypionkella sp.]
MAASGATERFEPLIENQEAAGRFVLVCEHATNAIPQRWGDLGLSAEARAAHIAWDPGAKALALALSSRLDAVLVHAPVSRLVYDCNRAPDMGGAMPAQSEIYAIAGNAVISQAERLLRTEAVYLPWVEGLHAVIARRIAGGMRPVVVTIHSFTPVFHGKPRRVELGVIHDADAHFAVAVQTAASKLTRLNVQLNAPYSAADDVTHTLRMQATPYGLPNVMLEIRNDLIATPEQVLKMADQLAAVLNMGLVEIQRQAKAS